MEPHWLWKEGFEENPNAMMVLWKDHTAIAEAEKINELAGSWGGEDYTNMKVEYILQNGFGQKYCMWLEKIKSSTSGLFLDGALRSDDL